MSSEIEDAYRRGFEAGLASAQGASILDLTIPAKPMGKGRPRMSVSKDGGAVVRTPDSTRDWERTATAHLMRSGVRPVRAGVPLHLEVETAGRRNGVDGFDVSRPDLDNIVKICMDSLAPSAKAKAWIRVLQDDAQICKLSALKRTLVDDEEPFVRMRLFDLTGRGA